MTTSPEAVAAPEHEPRACDAALSRAFEFLGKRWNGVLLGHVDPGPGQASPSSSAAWVSATRCCRTASSSSPAPAWSNARSTRGRRWPSPTH